MADQIVTVETTCATLERACCVVSAVQGSLQELAESTDVTNTLYALSNALEPVGQILEELREKSEQAYEAARS